MEQKATTPETGKLYANELGYTDVYPYEVIRTISDKTLEIRAMNATLDPSFKPVFLPGGYAGRCTNQHEQKWIFTSVEHGEIIRIRRCKGGFWMHKGRQFMIQDAPAKHYDYNF